MKVEIEQKLKELWLASREQNAVAIHLVTHMLLANIENGTASDFAKWCCRYSTGLTMETSIDESIQVIPPELSTDSGGKEWIC
ncbi:MAG TPA: hypothetical protein VFZ34_33550 [Blastocatellia bacterium]|nr:hypothetical protein [Blastocatellia bacterium]